MSNPENKITINFAPEWELELELQAEAAGKSKEDYLIELLEAGLEKISLEDESPPPVIH